MQKTPPLLLSATHQRLVELNNADTALPMQAGPKWACLLLPDTGKTLPTAQLHAAQALLTLLKPLNITLGQPSLQKDGQLACTAQDENGRSRAYALLQADGMLEIVAALPTGSWPPEERVWWPGSYEQALLTQLQTVYLPLARALYQTGASYLCMGLIGIGGTALIANERPHPLPSGIDLLQLPPVRLDMPARQIEQKLIQAFDQVRASACVASPHAFYL
ncbi:hypothetical protein [Vogesella sp. LIG4]|uniref:hypothetical protein n=1 Tax=Vogesella sp. LIG4 TaxID=1192162 RepID=UPI00081FEE55|nr:hypothetical protein [Vogesella sp. LIG4]SCK27277.1 hypothetical protein PSELUDRAFT_3316 [Vogesella sp. LIG4]